MQMNTTINLTYTFDITLLKKFLNQFEYEDDEDLENTIIEYFSNEEFNIQEFDNCEEIVKQLAFIVKK